MALGDRRSRVRLEVVGALWATLELTEPARVVNISREGVLISSPISILPNQCSHCTRNSKGERDRRRLRPARPSGIRDEPIRYLIGVEFHQR
jgi:hypothetical protein